MSWLSDFVSGPPAPYRDTTPLEDKVPDPSIPDRLVSAKQANQPFLAHKRYRDQRDKAHAEWLERKRIRDDKIARGETDVGPEEPDPNVEKEIGLLDILKFLVVVLVCVSLAGKFVTGSYLWEYDGKWVQKKTYWPAKQTLFTESQLAQYDGTDISKPIYLSIDGDVYDVSTNRRTYGPGGSYHILAGAEGGRSFATGCFKTHRTHDLRGLNEDEMRGFNHWKNFFANHKDYFIAGKLSLRPIDPNTPIPEHCDPKKAKVNEEKEARRLKALMEERQREKEQADKREDL